MDKIFEQHMKDLSLSSEKKGICVYTVFLSLDEQSTLYSIRQELCSYELYGGTEKAERKIARFAKTGEYSNDDYPIVCIKVAPKNAKFADELSHRDVLGAVMSLGIERSQTGDIYIVDNTAYMFVLKNKTEFIFNELKKIKHTDVVCSISENLPDGELIKTEEMRITAASERIDCIIASVYKLSRSASLKLIEGGKVFVDSREMTKPSFELNDGNTVSVRGYGKFIFDKKTGVNKKGRAVITVKKY